MNREIFGQILPLLSSPTPTIRILIWINSGMEYVTLSHELFNFEPEVRFELTVIPNYKFGGVDHCPILAN